MTTMSAPRIVTARKGWHCWRCVRAIKPGSRYWRRAIFPNMETNQGTGPLVIRAHLVCGDEA